jgi:hypothetical protein
MTVELSQDEAFWDEFIRLFREVSRGEALDFLENRLEEDDRKTG